MQMAARVARWQLLAHAGAPAAGASSATHPLHTRFTRGPRVRVAAHTIALRPSLARAGLPPVLRLGRP